jgi:general secretion pathway protein G
MSRQGTLRRRRREGPRAGRRRRVAGFTLIEVMIIVAIIGILLTIAIPGWIHARRQSQKTICQECLAQIDGAKEQWAFLERKSTGDIPTKDDLYGETLYVRKEPRCPADGVYTIEPVGQPPLCSLSESMGHYLP